MRENCFLEGKKDSCLPYRCIVSRLNPSKFSCIDRTHHFTDTLKSFKTGVGTINVINFYYATKNL
jgi:hypothetical protein